MSLTSKEVNEVFAHCLFVEEDDVTQCIVIVDVYGGEVRLHEGRATERKGDIKRLLRDLPGIFSRPQGACFLNMNFDQLGCIWTDNPEEQNRLFLLGATISAARVVLQPKEQSRLYFDAPFIRVTL